MEMKTVILCVALYTTLKALKFMLFKPKKRLFKAKIVFPLLRD
jgi:hypothetical protein